MRALLCAIIVMSCAVACSNKAERWSKLEAYRVGDLKIEAPRAMVNSAVPLIVASDTSKNENLNSTKHEKAGELVMLSLSIPHYRNIDFKVSKNEICKQMDAGWAKQYCSSPDIAHLRNLPDDIMLQSRQQQERLKSHLTLARESVFEHITEMNFDNGPLQVACDRTYVDTGSGRKRTCTAVLLATQEVFIVFSYGVVRANLDEIETTMNNACRHGTSLHRWLTKDIGIVPIYGSDKPKCPSSLSVRRK